MRQAKTSSSTISYEYDVDGLRTKKNVNGVVHNYVYASGKLLRESYTQLSISYVLDFVYDQNGRPYMLYLKKGSAAPKVFYYLLNWQGDVVRLVTADGVTAAEYRYDAWGKLTSTHTTSNSTVQNLATINPLRYRGYYYDKETGWYYLQSRYYDPGLGRFINADCYASTGQGFVGYNMFAYCNNNPVIKADPLGEDAVLLYDGWMFGHTGALIEGENGRWYHFYWGAEDYYSSGGSSNIRDFKAFTGAEPWIVCEPYNGDPCDLNDINADGMTSYAGTYSRLIYLPGDYSTCVKIVNNEGRILGKKYYAIGNNCNNVTHRLLSAAKTENRFMLFAASLYIFPEDSYFRLNAWNNAYNLFKKRNVYYTKHYEHDGM